jgi:hypothetical protein
MASMILSMSPQSTIPPPLHRGGRGLKNLALRRRAFHLFISGATYAAIGRELGVSRERAQQVLRPSKAIYDAVEARATDSNGGVHCQQCGILLHQRPTGAGEHSGPRGWRGVVHQVGNWSREPDSFEDMRKLVLVCRSCEMMNHGGGRKDGQ